MLRRSRDNSRRIRMVSTAKLLVESIAGKSCPICLCQVVERTAAVLIPCNHAFCVECIRQWSNLKRKCPLCNSEFDSWYFRINSSSHTFRKQKLSIPPPDKARTVILYSDVYSGRRRWLPERSRVIRPSRGVLNTSCSRTRPLPWRRSFSMARNEHPDVISERVLRWRGSVYEQQLQAIPLSSQNCLLQQIRTSDDTKKLVLQKIGPWIKRELHAVLGDPDPGVIVHVAASLFIAVLERNYQGPSGQSEVESGFLSPLQPFLQEKTKVFWHELRCFAECSYPMETYDRLVEYTRLLE